MVAAAKSLQSCPTLCDPIVGSPSSSPIPGILQARTLEWVVTKGESGVGGMNWEIGIDIYTLLILCIKYTN